MPVRTASDVVWSGLIAGKPAPTGSVLVVDVNVNLPSGAVNRIVTFT